MSKSRSPIEVEASWLGEFGERSPLSRQEAEDLACRAAALPFDFFHGALCLVPSGPFVEALMGYLRGRGHKRVIEVAAGYGLIKVVLNASSFGRGVEYFATDICPRNLEVVEGFSHLAAVRHYQPSCILVSWLPFIEGASKWPAQWAEEGVVEEYIVIGPCQDQGVINEYFLQTFAEGDLTLPGWEKVRLDQLSQEAVDLFGNASRAYSFRRA